MLLMTFCRVFNYWSGGVGFQHKVRPTFCEPHHILWVGQLWVQLGGGCCCDGSYKLSAILQNVGVGKARILVQLHFVGDVGKCKTTLVFELHSVHFVKWVTKCWVLFR